ncbi:hypothetical protein SFC65_13460 [Priestia filamentosa]|uniref:hypothetical protein n=1 Tax=Priestia filamentosa TaxID=1402861 RepID=UPI000589091D
MGFFLYGVLILNCLIGAFLYIMMRRKRKIFSDRYGMIMAMCASGVLSFALAMVIEFLNKNDSIVISILVLVISGALGIMFGALVKFQSLLSGFFQGTVGGIMGTMFGAVVKNPSLCNLPSESPYTVEQSIVMFSLFSTVLVIVTVSLLLYSFRV